MNDITVLQLKSLIPGVKIIDIRDNYQYNLGIFQPQKMYQLTFY